MEIKLKLMTNIKYTRKLTDALCHDSFTHPREVCLHTWKSKFQWNDSFEVTLMSMLYAATVTIYAGQVTMALIPLLLFCSVVAKYKTWNCTARSYWTEHIFCCKRTEATQKTLTTMHRQQKWPFTEDAWLGEKRWVARTACMSPWNVSRTLNMRLCLRKSIHLKEKPCKYVSQQSKQHLSEKYGPYQNTQSFFFCNAYKRLCVFS